jgi:cytochrome c oxidase cbb3-type subunit III
MASKKYIPTILLILASLTTGWGQAVQASAQGAAAADSQFPQIMTIVLTAAVALIVAVALLVILRANVFLTKRLIRLEAERNGVNLPEEVYTPQGDDFWTRIRKQYWEDPVPREREGDIMFHHAYDGIRELDNHLPPWWVNMFVITIVWAAGYMWYYHFGGNGPSSAEEYKTSVEVAKKEIAMALAGKADAIDESNVTALTESGPIGEGELIFKSVCAACHGQKGEGGVGPNMTDEHWIHGGGIKNVFKTIKYGVPEKGMIAWSSQLKPSDMQKVASYILTLKGTNPPNAKAPQGEVWKEEAASAGTTAPDSAAVK